MDIATESLWRANVDSAHYAPLAGPIDVDVAVIGAGITGLTAALHLKQAGLRVAVLEAEHVGAGTTGASSAHLDAHPEIGARQLISQIGEEAARLLTAGRLAAIDQIEAWCREVVSDGEFARIPAVYFTESADELSELIEDGQAAGTLGLSVQTAAAIELPFATAGGYRIEQQGRFHPGRYLAGLAAAVHGDNATIYEHTQAKPPSDGTPCEIETATGNVTAQAVLVCTHSPYFGVCDLDTRVAPYQSYLLTARIEEEFPDVLAWDDAEPYHYLRRVTPDDPHLVLIGGADHKTGQADQREALAELEAWTKARFTVRSIAQTWSAEFFEPDDGLPYIGRLALTENLYAATGFSGVGLTYGTMAGKLLADLVLDRPNPAADIVAPTRINLLDEAADFISENLNVAKRFVADRFAGESVESLDVLQPGEGRLVSYGGKQIAAYRDESGRLHQRSPVCTHMGCHVRWNELEKTWDCPCHGGRYSAEGERLYGPPPQDLKPLEE